MLTDVQKKKLAREARKLAMECVTGNAPDFDPGSWCGCACGVTSSRALPEIFYHQLPGVSIEVDGYLSEYTNGIGIVSIATDIAVNMKNNDALVFPLLALADALEAQP